MSRKAVKVAGILLGCCAWLAVSGCSFHRTEHGFVLHGGHWSLERNSEPPDLSTKTASEKPELLPWRGRLKGYRLGSRLFHEQESADASLTAKTKRPDLVAD